MFRTLMSSLIETSSGRPPRVSGASHHPIHGPCLAHRSAAMNRETRLWTILGLCLLLTGVFVLPPLWSQAPQTPQPEDTPVFGEEVSVGYVLVPVVVRSGAKYVKNLDEDDFRLLVDG